MERDTVLYKHIRKSDGIIFYIGIGNNKRPFSKRGRNQHWHNTIKKHDYIVEIITDNLTWDEACDLEIKFISFYGRNDLGLGNLVNWTDGGDGSKNRICNENTRKKISNNNKGKLIGYKHNKIRNKKISNTRIEKNLSKGENNFWFGKKRPEHSEKLIGKKRPDLSQKQKGENNSNSKINEKIVLIIRDEFKNGMKIKELIDKYQISKSGISKIVYRYTWKHI
jgi:hypothetical protein